MADESIAAGIELADMIGQLRVELGKAMVEGAGERLRFVPQSLELELRVSVARVGGGKAGIKFWILDAGVEHQSNRAREHTIRLKLDPRDVLLPGDPDTQLPGGPLLINAERDSARK